MEPGMWVHFLGLESGVCETLVFLWSPIWSELCSVSEQLSRSRACRSPEGQDEHHPVWVVQRTSASRDGRKGQTEQWVDGGGQGTRFLLVIVDAREGGSGELWGVAWAGPPAAL